MSNNDKLMSFEEFMRTEDMQKYLAFAVLYRCQLRDRYPNDENDVITNYDNTTYQLCREKYGAYMILYVFNRNKRQFDDESENASKRKKLF